MGLIGIIWIVVWGTVVGVIAKMIHPGDEKLNFLGTMLVGVTGSLLGGLVSFLVGWSDHVLATSGWFMSILGAVAVCSLWVNKVKIRAWISEKTGL